MSPTVHMPKALSVTREHVIPLSSRRARNLKDSAKWLAAEDEEMASIEHNKVIDCTSTYVPEGIVAITTMFIYALKWTLLNTIERYKARWVVRGFLEILDVHFNHDTTHAPVASDSSLLIMMSFIVRRDLHFKQLDVKTAFLNSPLEHDIWVRFPASQVHPLGHSFAKLRKSLYGLRQAAADWYDLQHRRLVAFNPLLSRSKVDPCFYYKVQDGQFFFVMVHVYEYAMAYSDQSYFDE